MIILKFKIKRKGFTLIELVIVLVIVGVLATIAAPSFFPLIEKGKNKEAIALVNSLRAGEQMYRLKSNSNSIINCGDLVTCGNLLGLALTSSEWTCAVNSAGVVFTASCTRAGSAVRVWSANCGNSTYPACVGTYCN